MPDGRIRFYKSAEGSAGGTGDVVVGSKAKSGQAQATDGDAYIQKLLNQGKTREQVMEESLVSSQYYDLFPSNKETATASDEYFKDKPIITTTTTENPPEKKKKCPPGFAFSKSRGCVKMPKAKGKRRSKNLKQKLSSTKKSTECVFGQKC